MDFGLFADANLLFLVVFFSFSFCLLFFSKLEILLLMFHSGIGFEKSYISTEKLQNGLEISKHKAYLLLRHRCKHVACLCSCFIRHCRIIHIVEVFYSTNKWPTKALTQLMYSLFASQVVIFITESLLFTANIGTSIKFMNDSTDYSSPGLLTSKTDSSHT